MSCLFDSFSKYTKESSRVIRSKICDYLETNPILFDDVRASQVIEWERPENSGPSNLRDYVSQMRSMSTWGGGIEINAFTHLYKTHVNVINIRSSNGLGNSYTLTRVIEFKCTENPSAPTLYITWNGYHYEFSSVL